MFLFYIFRYPGVDDIAILIESAKHIEQACRTARKTITAKQRIEKSTTHVISSISNMYNKLDFSNKLREIVEKESPKTKNDISPKEIKR